MPPLTHPPDSPTMGADAIFSEPLGVSLLSPGLRVAEQSDTRQLGQRPPALELSPPFPPRPLLCPGIRTFPFHSISSFLLLSCGWSLIISFSLLTYLSFPILKFNPFSFACAWRHGRSLFRPFFPSYQTTFLGRLDQSLCYLPYGS